MICIHFFLLFASNLYGPVYTINSSKLHFEQPYNDTLKVMLLVSKSKQIQSLKPDSALIYAQQGLDESRLIGYSKGEGDCLNRLGVVLMQNGKYDKALFYFLSSLKIREKINDQPGVSASLNNIGIIYSNQNDYKKALLYHFKAKQIAQSIHDKKSLSAILSNIGNCYIKLNKIDSALYFEMQAYTIQHATKDQTTLQNTVSILGDINYKMGHKELALDYYKLGIKYAIKNNDNNGLADTYNSIAELYQKDGQADSSIFYASLALDAAKRSRYPEGIFNAGTLLTQLYAQKNEHLELAYLKISMAAKDSMFDAEKIKEIQKLSFIEAARQQEIKEEKKREADERSINLQLIAIAIFIPLFFLILLLLSKSHTHPKVIEFMGVVSLLLVFEFITLFIHPFVQQISNHLPVLELLILVGLAAILVPMHHRLTIWLKGKLVHAKQHSPEKTSEVKSAGKKLIAKSAH
jgi:tetratricopeptide (TPR) repeat protein